MKMLVVLRKGNRTETLHGVEEIYTYVPETGSRVYFHIKAYGQIWEYPIHETQFIYVGQDKESKYE